MKFKLANYWKKIADIIILLTIGFLVINKIYNFHINKTTLASFGKISFTLAGLLFIMAREKIEDEYIMNIRLQAFSFSFLMGIIGYMIDESGVLAFLGEDNPHTMFRFIFLEIFTYITFFYALIYRILKFEKQS